MAGKRKFQSRRRARSNYKKRRYSGIKSVMSMKPRMELKAMDLDLNITSLAAAGSISSSNCLNLIQVGSSAWNRIGRKVRLVSLNVKGSLNNNTTNSAPLTIRVFVVYDTQPNGSYPTLSTIIGQRAYDGTASTGEFSGLNLDNKNRFVIIMDHQQSLPGVGTSSSSTVAIPTSAHLDKYIKLNGLTSTYSASSTPPVIGDIATGALYLFVMAKPFGGLLGDSGQFSGTVRLRFTD